ncbi:MAG: hypothetical protein A2145_04675 [candidate division Zixibacteria bacterium RBG_16_40_9]|nr:MAG: hypothetical protein A2145_04675 [candidate division Zixibacteria bacterium RBG_16_40_9]
MNPSKRWSFLFGFLIFIIVVAGLSYSFKDKLFIGLKTYQQIAAVISSRYVDAVDPQTLVQAGIKGMLSVLDPYSEYLEQREYQGLIEETQGQFEGVGMEIGIRKQFLTVISPIEGGPAYRAGIQAGDKIIKINGESAEGITADQAVKKLRGPKGTEVLITISRPGLAKPITYKLTRDVVEIKTVPYYGLIDKNIGYIRLKKFTETSTAELTQALLELKSQNASGIILDLRGNPGGLLTQAVEVASLFLGDKKLILETKGQDQSQNQKYLAGEKAVCPDLPLVVLVDEGSASASEIVAGAIQDWDRGVVIGDTTFGKGLVQTVLRLPNENALKLTTAKYFTPSGRCIQKKENGPNLDQFGLATRSDFKAGSAASDTNFTFYTKRGRKVSGEGGIIPDLVVSRPQFNPLIYNLLREDLFFEFALEYVAKNSEIDQNFEVNWEILKQFRRFLWQKNFTYQTMTEMQLEELKGIALEELSSPNLNFSLDQINPIIQEEKQKAFMNSAEEIKWYLKEAILTHNLGEKAKYPQVWAKNHPEVKKALEILGTQEKYDKLLSS